jgi:CRISPR/Cas system-associated exonuclease Cas4 (RecB family)
MTRPSFGLSKSRISAFAQCPRRLWQQVHAAERAQVDDNAKMNFATGHAVGDLACTLVPGGVMVEVKPDMLGALAKTAKLVSNADKPIYEATFAHEGVLVRVDILLPEKTDDEVSWHIAEVKSTATAKDYHVGDLATQYWVLRQNGVKIESAAIRHINTAFVLTKVGDYHGIFRDTQLLQEIRPIAENLSKVVQDAREMLAGSEPVLGTGPQCSTPFACEFYSHCSAAEPAGPEWPIAELPNSGNQLAKKWAEHGILDIRDLPEDAGLNALHERIRKSVIADSAFLDAEGAKSATQNWAYPRTWLDFETMAFAIPRWIGTRPYSQIAFQFSAHIEAENGSIDHIEALDLTGNDPRAHIASELAKLPAEGAVIAWNASFERKCLRDLAHAVPEYADRLASLSERTVDLLPVAKNNYYHPDQRGSFSIKAVLPTLMPSLDYGSLEIKDGGSAQLAYLEATAGDCTPARFDEIDKSLKNYCERDTWAMIAIYRCLMGEEQSET